MHQLLTLSWVLHAKRDTPACVLVSVKFWKQWTRPGQGSSVPWKCQKKCIRLFWEKGLCRKSSLSWQTAKSGYLEVIKCHFEVGYGKFGPFLSRIQSYFNFTHCYWAEKGFAENRHFHGTASLSYLDTLLSAFLWPEIEHLDLLLLESIH